MALGHECEEMKRRAFMGVIWIKMLTKWTDEIGFSNPKHGNKIKFRNL